MDEVAPSLQAERGRRRAPRARDARGLGALARVSRALDGTGSLAELASRALGEMRDALDLDVAALYLTEPGGRRRLERFVSSVAAGCDLVARAELRYEPEAWRLALASGMPIVFREPAGWLGPNPFAPAARDWFLLPLVSGRHDMVGVVAAAAARPVALDPVSATVLTLLGGQISAGITTARLHQRLQRAEMEQERRSLAADVHDGLAQDLALALRELALLDEPGLDDEAARAGRERLREAVAGAQAGSRLEDLRAAVPLGGLREAVEATAARFDDGGLPVRLSMRGAAADVSPETVAVVSRVLGEALANVARHASARQAVVSVRVEAERLELVVDDDGCGFDPGRDDGHFGLTIMRERARGCGGECEIGPRPGGGTRVAMRVPVH